MSFIQNIEENSSEKSYAILILHTHKNYLTEVNKMCREKLLRQAGQQSACPTKLRFKPACLENSKDQKGRDCSPRTYEGRNTERRAKLEEHCQKHETRHGEAEAENEKVSSP